MTINISTLGHCDCRRWQSTYQPYHYISPTRNCLIFLILDRFVFWIISYSAQWNSGLNIRLAVSREYRSAAFCSSLDYIILGPVSPQDDIEKFTMTVFYSGVLQLSPISTIPPMLHSHSSVATGRYRKIYHDSFLPRSSSALTNQYHSTNAPLSFVSRQRLAIDNVVK